MLNRYSIIVVSAFFMLTSCGFDSGLDGSTQMSDLSANEVQTLCEAEVTYFTDKISDADLINFLCVSTLQESGNDVCRDNIAECRDTVTINSPEDICTMTTSAQDCDITVDEYEACRTAYYDSIASQGSSASCSGDIEDPLNNDPCRAIEGKCTILGI